jgi:orotidine-5'-phosphate decarboxylase
LFERVVEQCVAAFPAERCGLVVGSTYPEEAARLRALAPDRMFLMPGVGAQGGDIGAIRAALDVHGGGVLPSASRSVLYAEAGAGFEPAAARAAVELKRQANEARSAGVAG